MGRADLVPGKVLNCSFDEPPFSFLQGRSNRNLNDAGIFAHCIYYTNREIICNIYRALANLSRLKPLRPHMREMTRLAAALRTIRARTHVELVQGQRLAAFGAALHATSLTHLGAFSYTAPSRV